MSPPGDPVVVGVDGSAASLGPVRWAADEAYRRRRPLRVIHAAGSDNADLLRHGQRLVDEAVAAARAWQLTLDASGFVHAGTPAAELCTESRHSDPVVVGSRGCGGIAGLLLGSASQQLLHHAACPVLLVR